MKSWNFGVLKTPLSINFKSPDIEDHFYKQEEIFTVSPIARAKINPILPMIGLIMTVIIPLSVLKHFVR